MQVLSLYKLLMRESQKLPNYNFRAYALRRVKDGFKANKTLADQKAIKTQFEHGKNNLNVIRRQATIGDMYGTEKLIIENVQ